MISERKSANARQQQGLTKEVIPNEKGTASGSEATGKRDIKEFNLRGALTTGNGAFTSKQARAFFTEAAKLVKPTPHTGGRGGPAPLFSGPTPKEFLVAFVKLSFFDIGCEGCGKWYRNAPDRKFPYPCAGRCQYEGHPVQNTKYKDGAKWKFPGFCCSWKGMEDKDIPAATLARLQKYSAQKREREPLT